MFDKLRNLLGGDKDAPTAFPGSGGEPYPLLHALLKAFAADAPAVDNLILGDSVMQRVSVHDTDKRPLAELIAETLAPGRSVLCPGSAHAPVIHRALLQVVAAQPQRPRNVIILAVNMRCFSPQWHLHPAYQFGQELRMIGRYLAVGTPAIGPIEDVLQDSKAQLAYERTQVQYALSKFRTIGEFASAIQSEPVDDAAKQERARAIFVFHYMHALVEGHPKLVALRDCLEIMTKMARPLVYLTPLNVEAGTRLLGDEFLVQLRRNVGLLKSVLGHRLSDWTELLPARCFFHEQLVTEHLNESGRRALVDMIRQAATGP